MCNGQFQFINISAHTYTIMHVWGAAAAASSAAAAAFVVYLLSDLVLRYVLVKFTTSKRTHTYA